MLVEKVPSSAIATLAPFISSDKSATSTGDLRWISTEDITTDDGGWFVEETAVLWTLDLNAHATSHTHDRKCPVALQL